ncbi:inositol monophosphatase family protein [Streptomyces sp. SP17KL33]|uniref:inositol monophosphatase family protein n=1 Tax=Streptomyces sp. SP17KL33 TaxID=3002534 RepID=UPI002E767B79|nr:inositol monophosphatase [Streptomyces sp. SP17KL33]MEE1831721.1 inositol monophosphatase [Streptomyces sp. SP17KL33]
MKTASEYTTFIDSSLREASRMAVRMQGAGHSRVKAADVNQVVTDADLALGALLTERIRGAYPRHGILEEESGASPGDDEIVWIVDPVDGSSNYAAGSPLYGIMMAVVGSGGVLAGGMALPAFNTVYLASSGGGATRNGQLIEPLPVTALDRSLVAYGLDKGPPDSMATEGRLIAAIGAACQSVRMSNSVFDTCMVADGTYGAFLHRNCRIWDVAAAVCILQECGGICTDLSGRPLELTDPFGRAEQIFEVCFASTTVHPTLMGAVAGVLGPSHAKAPTYKAGAAPS